MYIYKRYYIEMYQLLHINQYVYSSYTVCLGHVQRSSRCSMSGVNVCEIV